MSGPCMMQMYLDFAGLTVRDIIGSRGRFCTPLDPGCICCSCRRGCFAGAVSEGAVLVLFGQQHAVQNSMQLSILKSVIFCLTQDEKYLRDTVLQVDCLTLRLTRDPVDLVKQKRCPHRNISSLNALIAQQERLPWRWTKAEANPRRAKPRQESRENPAAHGSRARTWAGPPEIAEEGAAAAEGDVTPLDPRPPRPRDICRRVPGRHRRRTCVKTSAAGIVRAESFVAVALHCCCPKKPCSRPSAPAILQSRLLPVVRGGRGVNGVCHHPFERLCQK